MFEAFIPMLFGWPAILLSLCFAGIGLWIRRPALLVTSAILMLLPAWYLSNYTIAFASLPLFLLASAYSISKNKINSAILLFIPVLLAMGWLGFIVLSQ